MSSKPNDCTAVDFVYTIEAAHTLAPQELPEPLRKFLRPPIAIYRRAAEDIERMCKESDEVSNPNH